MPLFIYNDVDKNDKDDDVIMMMGIMIMTMAAMETVKSCNVNYLIHQNARPQ